MSSVNLIAIIHFSLLSLINLSMTDISYNWFDSLETSITKSNKSSINTNNKARLLTIGTNVY